jgi:hypothetical protein
MMEESQSSFMGETILNNSNKSNPDTLISPPPQEVSTDDSKEEAADTVVVSMQEECNDEKAVVVSIAPELLSEPTEPLADGDDNESAWDDTLSHVHGSLLLQQTGTTTSIPVVVPNVCAICLTSYTVGDTVVWSSNPECRHAFHEECLLQWLVHSKQEGTPCPCCRQSFTDLETFRKKRKVRGAGQTAFNPRVIAL